MKNKNNGEEMSSLDFFFLTRTHSMIFSRPDHLCSFPLASIFIPIGTGSFPRMFAVWSLARAALAAHVSTK
jgi:hypothetical protein